MDKARIIMNELQVSYGYEFKERTHQYDWVKALINRTLDAVNKNGLLPRVINCKPDEKAALNGAVKAIYFADNSDYLSGLYEVVRSLTNLDEPTDEDIKMLYNELNPD